MICNSMGVSWIDIGSGSYRKMGTPRSFAICSACLDVQRQLLMYPLAPHKLHNEKSD